MQKINGAVNHAGICAGRSFDVGIDPAASGAGGEGDPRRGAIMTTMYLSDAPFCGRFPRPAVGSKHPPSQTSQVTGIWAGLTQAQRDGLLPPLAGPCLETALRHPEQEVDCCGYNHPALRSYVFTEEETSSGDISSDYSHYLIFPAAEQCLGCMFAVN